MSDLVNLPPHSLPAIADRVAVEPELPVFVEDALDYDLETDRWRRDFLSRHGKRFNPERFTPEQRAAIWPIAERYEALLAPPPTERLMQWLTMVNMLVANPKTEPELKMFATAMMALEIPLGFFTAKTAGEVAKTSKFFPSGKEIYDMAEPMIRRWRIIHNRLKEV